MKPRNVKRLFYLFLILVVCSVPLSLVGLYLVATWTTELIKQITY